MHPAGTSSATDDQLPELPDPALARIFELVDIETLRNARRASKRLAYIGAGAVRTLGSWKAIPRSVWDLFRNASRLVSTLMRRSFQQKLAEQLPELPERLTYMEIKLAPSPADARVGKPAWVGESLGQLLQASPCCASLQELRLAFRISTADADAILASCASLQHAELKVHHEASAAAAAAAAAEPAAWSPAADLSHLRSLILQHEGSELAATVIELQALAAAKALQQLVIEGHPVIHPAALSQLASLEVIHISWPQPSGQQPLAGMTAAPLTELQHLRKVCLPNAQCTAAQWHNLVLRSKQLSSVHFGMLAIDAAAPAAAAVTALGRSEYPRMCLELQHGEDLELRGCLAEHFPQLQRLAAETYEQRGSGLQQLLLAAGGHPVLCDVQVHDGRALDPAEVLLEPAVLPAATSININTPRPADVVLMALQGCPQVATLHVNSKGDLTPTGLEAVAAAAYKGSLERLYLEGVAGAGIGMELLRPAVETLLTGAMPALLIVDLDLVVWMHWDEVKAIPEDSGKASEVQKEMVLGLLQGAGVAGDWGVPAYGVHIRARDESHACVGCKFFRRGPGADW
jgi:hypothetical protein